MGDENPPERTDDEWFDLEEELCASIDVAPFEAVLGGDVTVVGQGLTANIQLPSCVVRAGTDEVIVYIEYPTRGWGDFTLVHSVDDFAAVEGVGEEAYVEEVATGNEMHIRYRDQSYIKVKVNTYDGDPPVPTLDQWSAMGSAAVELADTGCGTWECV